MCIFLQAIQQHITDHEPEFVSLKRGVQELCNGPSAESAHNDALSSLDDKEGRVMGRDLPRPGQKEQLDTIADYDKRVEALKRKLAKQSADLSTQLKKGEEFDSLTSDLSSWLDELERGLDDFKISDPKSGVICAQQEKCQVQGTEYRVTGYNTIGVPALLVSVGVACGNMDRRG